MTIDIGRIHSRCPDCGGSQFLQTNEIDGDPVGHLTCTACGWKITIEAYNEQAKEVAKEALKRLIGKGR